jgi:anti-sigma regulatory factor (Ser/Thr protein kinase)
MSGEIQLQKEDKLIFFTDGLTDIPHKSGKRVLNTDDMKNMIAAIVRDEPHLPISILMARLFNQINGQAGDNVAISHNFDDDITLLGLELENGRYEYEDIVRPENLDDFDRCVNSLYRKISAEWEEKGFPSPETRLRMVLEEAMVNAWSHGNHEDPQKMIVIRRRYGNDAVLEVIDEGDGFDFKTFYDPTSKENLLKPQGRGNFIMRLLTEETQWKDGGRHLISYFSREDKSEHDSKSFPGLNLWRRSKRD